MERLFFKINFLCGHNFRFTEKVLRIIRWFLHTFHSFSPEMVTSYLTKVHLSKQDLNFATLILTKLQT